MTSTVRNVGRPPDRGQSPEPEPTEPSLPPLIVGVRHGSLEHAPYRLLLGHFQGLPLTSAEARLNERSDGRLERLLLMNLYPQRLGEMAVLEPVDEAPPQGAVIMGLGPTGELTAAQLRGVVTRALLRVALNVLDRRLAEEPGTAPPFDASPLPLGVSAVLIGSSTGGGLTVEGSVRALIDGVLVANAGLGRLKVGLRDGQHPATDVVRYDVLEMIERYEDRVDLVVGVLAGLQHLDARVPDRGRRQPVQLQPQARVRGGSLDREPADRRGRGGVAPGRHPGDGGRGRHDRAPRVHVDRPAGPSGAGARRRRAGDRRSAGGNGDQRSERRGRRWGAVRTGHPPGVEGRPRFGREPSAARRAAGGRPAVGAAAAPSRGLRATGAVGAAGGTAPPVPGERRAPLRVPPRRPRTTSS